MLFLLVLR